MTVNTSKRLDIIPDKVEARYKTDNHFDVSGYEFTMGWSVR